MVRESNKNVILRFAKFDNIRVRDIESRLASWKTRLIDSPPVWLTCVVFACKEFHSKTSLIPTKALKLHKQPYPDVLCKHTYSFPTTTYLPSLTTTVPPPKTGHLYMSTLDISNSDTVNSRYLEVEGTVFYNFKLPDVLINLTPNYGWRKQSKCIFDSERLFEFRKIRIYQSSR